MYQINKLLIWIIVAYLIKYKSSNSLNHVVNKIIKPNYNIILDINLTQTMRKKKLGLALTIFETLGREKNVMMEIYSISVVKF